MSLVLAIEPDLRQAAILKRIVREKVRAQLVLVDSRDAAISAIDAQIPDVILVTALLSPRDEEELVAHLKTLSGAEHLQTHTIPQLASGHTENEGQNGGGLFGKFRKKKESGPIAGCDPDMFAEEIGTFLERASQLKGEALVALHSRVAQLEAQQPLRSATQQQTAAHDPAPHSDSGTEPASAGTSSWSSPFEWRRSEPAAAAPQKPAEPPPQPVVTKPLVSNVPLAVLADEEQQRAEAETERQRQEAERARLEAEAARHREEAARQREEAVRRRKEEEARIAREQLEREERERRRKEEDARIAREREEAERKRKEAEVKAAREREEAARKRKEEEARIAREREEAERRHKEAEARAARERQERAEAERRRKEAEAKAERERLAREEVERKRKEAEARAARERQEREEIERKRKEAEARAARQRQEREEAERRRLEAEAKAARERREREEAELRRLEAVAKAERERREREEAELRRLEAEAQAERERLEREAAERERVAAEERAAREKAEADRIARLKHVKRKVAATVKQYGRPDILAARKPASGDDDYAAFRDGYDEGRAGVLRLVPLAIWARSERLTQTDPPEPTTKDDLREIMSHFALPPQVAGVNYPHGCRIRRVRVPASPDAAHGKHKDPLIVSRRALDEARDS